MTCDCDMTLVFKWVTQCLTVAERLYWDARGSGSNQDCAHAAAAYASHARYALHVCR